MNFVIKNPFWTHEVQELLFGTEHVIVLDKNSDMFDVLVSIGSFKSKGDARKNWKQTGKNIPMGFNSFCVGKKRINFWIWNPIPDPFDINLNAESIKESLGLFYF